MTSSKEDQRKIQMPFIEKYITQACEEETPTITWIGCQRDQRESRESFNYTGVAPEIGQSEKDRGEDQ